MHPDWSKLPHHLVDSILERMELPSDHLCFSVVCKSWYGIAKDNRNLLSKMILLGGQYPPMLLIYANGNETWNLYSVMKNKVLNMQTEVPDNYKRFCGSSKGWLIAMDENLAVALINPFCRVKGREAKENSTIRLPPVAPPAYSVGKRNFWGKKYERFVYKATITTDPTINPVDCIVVVIYEDLSRLAFIRLNKDITWTYIAGDYRLNIEEVAYVDQRFYAVMEQSFVL